MAGQNKTRQVGIKIEEELAEFLESLPNRSEFIRQAILTSLGKTCPLCDGCGVTPSGLTAHFQEIIAAHGEVCCRNCGQRDAIHFKAPSGTQQARWLRFLTGNGYYCARCFPKAPQATPETQHPDTSS
ncbi:MAG: ribbon-helix-helix domain-containing protein [Gemmataceae bacterium]